MNENLLKHEFFMKPAIVVPAFNRPSALRRLLGSLAAADYPSEAPRLVISIEGGAPQEVVKIVEKFTSSKLHVEVIRREKRLGLREHVLSCGDLTFEHESIILLEDDLFVDRFFYNYASKALEFYERLDSVAGIALYAPEYNELIGLPFRPMQNGYSTYLMQVACSWGQCWTKQQWSQFRTWYSGVTAADLNQIDGLPDIVKAWPESSWKKYFNGYLVERKRYFPYPYQGFTTNCSDSGGTHIRDHSSIHQVCLATAERPPPNLTFCPETDQEVVYDAFMDPIGDFVFRTIGMDRKDIAIDINGIKPVQYLKKWRFVVTPKRSTEITAAYRYNFRPPEMNLKFPVSESQGDFYIVESRYLEPYSSVKLRNSIRRFNYYAGLSLIKKEIFISVLCSMLAELYRRACRVFGFHE